MPTGCHGGGGRHSALRAKGTSDVLLMRGGIAFVCLFPFSFFSFWVLLLFAEREGRRVLFFCIFSGSVYLSLAVCFSFRSIVLLLLHHLLLSLFPPSLSSELSFIWFYFHLLSFFFVSLQLTRPVTRVGGEGGEMRAFSRDLWMRFLVSAYVKNFVLLYLFFFVSLFSVLFSISILYLRICFLLLLTCCVFLFLLLF